MSNRSNKTKESIKYFENRKYSLVLGGIAVGLVSGLLVSVFRLILGKGDMLRNFMLEYVKTGSWPLVLGIALMILAYIGVTLAYAKVPLSSGSGIPQVKGELLGQVNQNWWQVLIAKFVGGFCALGAGLSLGREGPSVQIGAVAGKGLAKLTGKLGTEEKMMITCGAAAGLSSAFCAPLAGTVFALEELHKNFSTAVLVSTLAASIAADFVALYIFGLEPVFQLHNALRLPILSYWRVILLGIIVGAFGVLYNKVTDIFQNLYSKIDSPWLKMAIPFALCAGLMKIMPQVLGGGHPLVGKIATGQFGLLFLAALLIVKFLFSMFSFGSGSPGGIFLPLLVLGAIIGGFYGEIMELTGLPDAYLINFVILGMTGCFTSIVRAPVTGVILITEMTGDFTNFMPLAIVALVSFVTADLLHGKPIYDQLLERMLKGKDTVPHHEAQVKRKILLESPVYIGSLMDGRPISDMLLPKGCLIVSVERGGKEVVPNGSTVLKGGDKLVLLCAESYVGAVNDKLDKICQSIIR